MLTNINPEKAYPQNLGKKWTLEEENLLLKELNMNIDIQEIAERHCRTIGGINARRKQIAYELYIAGETNENGVLQSKNSIEDIILKTKLDEEQIINEIRKREKKRNNLQNDEKNDNIKIINKKPIKISNEINEIKNDIKELRKTMKDDINELKKTLNSLVEMMNAVYEFEDT